MNINLFLYSRNVTEKMNKMRKVIGLFCLSVLCLSCSDGKQSKNEKAVVQTVEVVESKHLSTQSFSFISKPYRTTELSFRVGGPIKQFEVLAGNHYRKGDIIATIDSRDFLIRKERAEAVYNQANAEFVRIESLYKLNNISASAYEKAKSDYMVAKTSYDTAQNELNDTQLRAPFDGYIGEVYIEKHQDVKATQPVFSFVELDRLKIEAYVPQQIAMIASDLKEVELSFDILPGQTFSATVEEISKSPSKNNLSYLFTAVLPNKDSDLLAGMSGVIRFEKPAVEETQILMIPQSVVCNRPALGTYVWVISKAENGEPFVEQRKIAVGDLKHSGYVHVLSGLQKGDVLAASGLRFLTDRAQITLQ